MLNLALTLLKGASTLASGATSAVATTTVLVLAVNGLMDALDR